MPTGVYPRMDPPWPHCPGCGMPLDLGRTVYGHRAWFCLSWSCRWYQSAVVGVYYGATDTEANMRKTWESRRAAEGRKL